MFKKILVPLDGSENGEIVFPYSAELASKFDSTVILVTVSESATPDIDHLYRTYLKHARKKYSGKCLCLCRSCPDPYLHPVQSNTAQSVSPLMDSEQDQSGEFQKNSSQQVSIPTGPQL